MVKNKQDTAQAKGAGKEIILKMGNCQLWILKDVGQTGSWI